MLNRTNRTLSANLNRLNLGTRSLVLLESVKPGKQTLHTRHDHRFAMRASARMFASSDPAITPSPSRIRMTDILGSPSVVPSWPTVGLVVRQPTSESGILRAYSLEKYARSVQPLSQSQAECVKSKQRPLQGLCAVKVRTVGDLGLRATGITAAAAIVAGAAGG